MLLNGQITKAADYARLVLKTVDGAAVRLSDVADVIDGVANSRLAAWQGAKPAIIINVTKTAEANVIETVDRVKAVLPQVTSWISPDIKLEVLTDRTATIRCRGLRPGPILAFDACHQLVPAITFLASSSV